MSDQINAVVTATFEAEVTKADAAAPNQEESK